jgi:prolyl 4-hydroxylase
MLITVKSKGIPSSFALLVMMIVGQHHVGVATSEALVGSSSSSSLSSAPSSFSSSSSATFYTAFDDTSWAVNEREVSSARYLGSSRQRDLYGEFLSGCARASSALQCRHQENWRMQQNMYQPRSVVNYTQAGFLKVRAPEELYQLLLKFWETNRHETVEEWPGRVSTYHNSWTAPTRIVRIENDTLPGGGYGFASRISKAVRPMLEEWTGMRLASASAYGIRVYRNGSILAPHVDPLPLVTSAILSVAQENMREPWPLEFYDHDGVAHNVTMEPGDMIFYESHSVIHGRPFPLNGSCFASVCTSPSCPTYLSLLVFARSTSLQLLSSTLTFVPCFP